jgi:hypothetical protein
LADGPLGRLFWSTLDALDYWLTQAQLWLVEMRCTDLNPRRPLRMSGTIHSLIQTGAAEDERLPATPPLFGVIWPDRDRQVPLVPTRRRSTKCQPPDGAHITGTETVAPDADIR